MPTRRGQYAAVALGAAWLLVGTNAAVAVHAQSLGEVARREVERRKEAAQAPGHVYTNENLAAEPSPSAPQSDPSPEATVEAATPSTPASSSGMVVVENPETHRVNFRSTTTPPDNRDEAYWRGRAKDVRGRLARATADLEASQTRLAALDAGPQTPAAARERSIVAAIVKRLQSEMRHHHEGVAVLQTHAEMAKVSPEWIK